MTKTGRVVCNSVETESWKNNLKKLKTNKFTGILGLSLSIFLVVGIMIDSGLMVAYGTQYSQYAATQTNDCGNGFLASGVNCSNDLSTIQGDSNIVVNEGVTPSNHGTYSDGGYSDRDKSAGISGGAGENSDSEQGTDPLDETVNGGVSENPSTGSTNDPTRIVLPCCDEMPISFNV